MSKLHNLIKALNDPDYIGPANHFAPDAEVILTKAYRNVLEEPDEGPVSLEVKLDADALAQELGGLEGLFFQVMAERRRQDEQWGGPEHDDRHDVWDWLSYIRDQGDKLAAGLQDGQMPDPGAARERMVKIAALAFAAIESMDRITNRQLPEGDRLPEKFDKAQFLQYLDAALPDHIGIRSFSIEYWPGITDKDPGTVAWGRARAATQEYLPSLNAQVSEVVFNCLDGSIRIDIQA